MKKLLNRATEKANGTKRLTTFLFYAYPLISLYGLFQFATSFFLAKKSMSYKSLCKNDTASVLLQNEIGLSLNDIEYLQGYGILAQHQDITEDLTISEGCWMPRRVDSMAVIVVDALRFDFALEHLPKSIGSRIAYEEIGKKQEQQETLQQKTRGQSQLYKFVADPPTVTMQRLKGLTTGGLPTFADISGSFGGANVDEDSWVDQLHNVPASKRGFKDYAQNQDAEAKRKVQMAFVGDDTWVDLFPNQFDDSHPYPSFNTRDLDTVDDGCLLHLPRLLKSFGSKSMDNNEGTATSTKNDESFFYEVIVTHFLGVDHVGHTYGPHNVHMDAKLNQMDEVLQTIFLKIDEAVEQCQVVFVFGDHGMTEDGNHGGGTVEETNAGLFAHYSPGCGDLGPSLDITGTEIGSYSEAAFRSVNQIDLVPTISLLLGLPIPFANLGGVVPGLLPPLHYHTDKDIIIEAPYMATSLALNAAQVWNYLTTYSNTASKLPESAISDLESILKKASSQFRDALAQKDTFDSMAYREACGLFKYFLSMATDLGKQVWTRFDTTGMIIGISMLVLALFLGVPYTSIRGAMKEAMPTTKTSSSRVGHILSQCMKFEVLTILGAIILHCVILTFSNSYIISEETMIMFTLSILCTFTSFHYHLNQISTRVQKSTLPSFSRQSAFIPLLVAICSRMNNILISGHGQDPIIRLHWAHNAYVFIFSLFVLGIMRIICNYTKSFYFQLSNVHTMLDIITVISLGCSWIEKRSLDMSRHGYFTSRLALLLCTFGFISFVIQLSWDKIFLKSRQSDNNAFLYKTMMVLWKVALFMITVTGPSAASSFVLIIFQVYALSILTFDTGRNKVSILIAKFCILNGNVVPKFN